ncbi:DUF3488 and transglutaminase-like domain-containing protein [Natronoglycomyces albus]|uniref:Transglutaminase domain-containing protein n=1 Tax=Natronoglycomyces albus TaxID=2811108 RepID=A0A895XGM1_9ACTN|nr:transglutaminase domain-containing protein [Natronoglycomyces albus]QSB04494.1 transglutaminase domain-containing protein [Natronoglycomyces albus]
MSSLLRVTSYRLRMATVALCLITLCALAGAASGRVYTGHVLTVLVSIAAFAAVTIGILLRNRSATLAWLVSIAGLFTMLAAAVLVTTDLSQPYGATFFDALVNAVPRTLTALMPIEATPDTVVLPILLTWVAAAAGCEFAVRFGQMLAGLAPATALYGASLYLVGPNADLNAWWGLAFAAVAAVALAVTATEPAARPDRDAIVGDGLSGSNTARSALSRTGSLAAAGVLALAMAFAAPWAAGMFAGQPSDPRQYVEPPELTDRDLNPLIRISGWSQRPEQELLHTNMSEADWLRLAVLTEYDGVTWQTGNNYRNAGSVLPGEAPGVGPLSQTVTVEQLDGMLLPAAADPRTVTGIPVAIDGVSRTLLTPDGLRTGDTYEITSMPTEIDSQALEGARADQSDLGYLNTPPGVPEVMLVLAEHIRANYDTPAAQAQGLADFLGKHYSFDEDAPSGHAYPNLEFFLQAHPEHGGQRGTSEQFAATFAVVGRLLGLPTRVVIGFEAQQGSSTVTAGDAMAWPEVNFLGVGWVRFDPLPEDGFEPIPPEEELEQEEEEEEEESEDDSSQGDNAEDYHDESLEESDADLDHNLELDQARSIPVWVWFALVAVMLLAVPVALKIRRRMRLRRRLFGGSAADRVDGAWCEVVATSKRLGIKVAASATASETMSVIATSRRSDIDPNRKEGWIKKLIYGPAMDRSALVEALGQLPQLVNHAHFAPAQVSDDQAFEAMRCVKRYVARARNYLPLWKKLLT